jgi:hypothetical protein
MRAYHAFVVSVALLVLSVVGMDLLHGGWEAAASGLMLVSAVVAPLAFAVLVGQAERQRP